MAEEVIQTNAPSFHIDLRPKAITLPDAEDRTKLNVRYPLLPPHAFAHVAWDPTSKELVYQVEQQVLTDTEKELLSLIKLGLEELINISYTSAKESNLIMPYFEKNVQSILLELGAKVSPQTYQKIMYYIYRDFVGLNEIEPLMNDPFIEDIECNGIGLPIYIVHRKYQNLRTNVVFEDEKQLVDFVEKLAQKSGRYVSFAKPLLDGTLPDGSRVNATYTEDVTTHGPTFTIRKFTKDPLTPIHLMDYKTGTAESFAFLWMVIENKFNIMIVGETAAGKTTFLNSVLQFVPSEARIVSIEDTREIALDHSNWIPSVARTGFGIPNLLGKQYGEITLFDLLKETFRQNPDYVAVGEVRGKETYVLFQGMASGHPSISTFHAASVEMLVRRLQTPPINLPAALVSSLDVVCSMIHVKDHRRSLRRLRQMDEVTDVRQNLGDVDAHAVFKWEPASDTTNYQGDSVILQKIAKAQGVDLQKVEQELAIRTRLLQEVQKRGISNYKEFSKIINDYYKDSGAVLRQFGLA